VDHRRADRLPRKDEQPGGLSADVTAIELVLYPARCTVRDEVTSMIRTAGKYLGGLLGGIVLLAIVLIAWP
jgi:hypothetical protein